VPRRRPDRHANDPYPVRPLGSAASSPVRESGPDGEWLVRQVAGAHTEGRYRCPGCDHQIAERTPHVVAWPADEPDAIAQRRHWHRGCWTARHHRRPPNGR